MRVHLPIALEAHGFPALAARAAALSTIAGPFEANELRALARAFRVAIYEDAIDAAAAAANVVDDLERARARELAQSKRYDHAALACSLALEVAGV